MMKRMACSTVISRRRRSLTQSARRASSLAPCPVLSTALPQLRAVFANKSTKNPESDKIVFPLLSKKIEANVWKTVKLNQERKAAVLVPLVSFDGTPSLLFTVRSSHLPTHASEVSFPGGHFDVAEDSTLEDTAVREAQEELLGEDYPWDKVEVLGQATALPSIKGTPVTPVIAVFPVPIHEDTFPGHDGEVEEVFCVSLEDLIAMETTEPSPRFRADIPVFPAGDNQRIWGLTAVITQPLLHKLFKPVFLMKNENAESRSRL
ncbi:Nudix hydrolase NudL [Seminavis robusta]|uniref:Nudix hydrolase NudL n=1 Tax=Seminavis robusta TaxID=568900 RepID=A0A9N8DI56_9STRA|nr:Nudix hydrolase NudL [Seminavis robusta]|eukprot:Sro170_g075550.1 Nudix hydrolase NudL (263) ;mRNA; r:86653-87441